MKSFLGTARGELLPAFILVACAAILHGPGLFDGPIFWERDTTLFYYPLSEWFGEQLRSGRFPLWMPEIFGGYPLVADGEIGPLYPPTLVAYLLLPPGAAFVTLRLFHSALAGLLQYALLRVLGVGPLGSLVGGLTFSFGSFLVAQMQHENMVRSAVWLPLEVLLLERAFRARGWARQRWLIACGIVLGLACLGLHIQAVAMSVIAIALYSLYRSCLSASPGALLERALLLFWAPAVVTTIGVGIAAAQWLPLFELARTSYRGPGLIYSLATSYSLAPSNLPSLLFPYFFRTPEGLWWSLWAPWETLPYAGIAPLGLALLGLLALRPRAIWYFAALVLLGLWVALSHYAPLNLHELLWRLPGFSSLRAPGRFTFLFVFGIAGLAAFGLDTLTRQAESAKPPTGAGLGLNWPRLRHGLVGAVLVTLALALPIAALLLAARLSTDLGYAQQLVDDRFLNLPRENPDLRFHHVYQGLLASLTPTAPKTLLSLTLLLIVGGALLLACLRPARARLVAALLAALTSVDLLLFAADYHPRATRQEIEALPAVAAALGRLADGERVFVEPALRRIEPNRLVLGRVRELNGYSSLQSQRHFEYAANVDRVDNVLVDLWNGRYYVVPASRQDIVIPPGSDTAYRPYELLLRGGAGSPTGRERFTIEPTLAGEVRVLAALSSALAVPQDATVAVVEILATDGRLLSIPLRAGRDLSEHAIDRPDVAPLAKHARARVVGGLPDQLPSGDRFTSNIYYSAWSFEPMEVREVAVRAVSPEGSLLLWGLGLVEPGGGRVRSLFADDRAKYERPPLYRDDEAVVFRNSAAFPRAYLVPEAIARRTRSDETAIARMALRPFEPRLQVVLEEGPFEDLPALVEPRPDGGEGLPVPAAVALEEISPERLRLTGTGPGVLVVAEAYHRGWRAYLDDRTQEVPVYLANYVNRAVVLPPGEHTVDLEFDPLSWRLGLAISLAVLASTCLALVASCLGAAGGRRRGGSAE